MTTSQPKASRRGFFLSASVAGAAVASAGWLKARAPAALAEPPIKARANGGGYSLSEHVKRYYQTTRV